MIKDGRGYLCQQCQHPDQKGLHTCIDQNQKLSDLKPGEWRNANIAAQFGSYSTSPIKVFTVCVNSEMGGKYIAFLGSDPAQRFTSDSRLEAVALLLAHTKLIVMTEID